MKTPMKIRLTSYGDKSNILVDHDAIQAMVDLPATDKHKKRCRVHFCGTFGIVNQTADDINALICAEQLKSEPKQKAEQR